ncbi:MAG: sulfate/molybdate ABC transporter ATP-binding protein [Deltaproteobacteria bacterium]
MSIEINNISKQFGNFIALKEVSLQISSGELVALLGPSGSGKTTLLRIISGLETADAGTIHINGVDTTGHHVRERKVGFVFQHYALFRHMTVFENVAFGLRVKPHRTRPSKAEIRERVAGLLKLVQLEALSNRYPFQLSGGQRQRIALARALAVEPEILLLDEPFGALDAQVRAELRRWLRRLHDEIHVTSVFVTHDQEEALEVADRIVVMNKGKVEQVGTPAEVYDNPANPFVLNFLGNVNLFRGRVHKGLVNLGGINLTAPEHSSADDTPAVAYVRSHDLVIEREISDNGSIAAEIKHIHAVGPVVRVTLTLNGNHGDVEAELTRDTFQNLALERGEMVFVRPRNVRVFVEDYQI